VEIPEQHTQVPSNGKLLQKASVAILRVDAGSFAGRPKKSEFMVRIPVPDHQIIAAIIFSQLGKRWMVSINNS